MGCETTCDGGAISTAILTGYGNINKDDKLNYWAKYAVRCEKKQ